MLDIPATMTAEPVRCRTRLTAFIVTSFVKANREKLNLFGGT